MAGKLYLCATPIGNLDDVTPRVIETLNMVDMIAAEDTRHTIKLLNHYQIKTPMTSYHEFNKIDKAKYLIREMEVGKNIALVSDAGTPGISDPGARLAEAVRQSGHTVVPVPGASAFVTLLSVAGNVGKTFTFEGFLSPKKGRRTRRLEELVSRGESFIIYESPFRILKTLEDVRSTDPSCRVVVGRELTKQFEEIFSSDISSAIEMLSSKPSIKGEFAVVVIPSGGACDNAEEDQDS